MQVQLPSAQQQQYHIQTSPQSQYPSNGILSELKHQSADYSEGQSNGTMNPYQQYSAGSYGQQQSHHPYHAQQPQHQQPQSQQHPHHQQQQQQRPYMPQQLPPLSAQMSQMAPVRSSPNPHQTGSSNNAQSTQYGSLPPHTMPHPQQAQTMPHAQSHQPLAPPASRPPAGTQRTEPKMSQSNTSEGFKYSLEVVQQPQRARMCGFGDKDRRPITPPPCVRLVIVEVATGREIDVNDIQSDPSFFVLQVDLWAENADREANVVRASSNSPAVSISSATTTSYPPPADAPRHLDPPVMYMTADGQPMYAHSMPGYPMPLARPGMMYQPQHPGNMYYPPVAGHPISYMPPAQQPTSAMYTRNLIGSLTVNASRLNDVEGKPGYWFVLQDLSVRTEGFFRLRMSFIDISNRGAPGVNRGKAPVLAWTFSEKFQVYSAKKFPGVIESTPLSKCFASQGIKIPIRKDNKGDAGDDDDGDL